MQPSLKEGGNVLKLVVKNPDAKGGCRVPKCPLQQWMVRFPDQRVSSALAAIVAEDGSSYAASSDVSLDDLEALRDVIDIWQRRLDDLFQEMSRPQAGHLS